MNIVYFFLTLIIPLLIASGSFILTTSFPQGNKWRQYVISWKEFLILVGISLFISIVSMVIVHYMQTTYIEMWNGIVIKKARVKVSCEHSYNCNCRQEQTGTDSDGNATYSQVCDTCYEHSHDFSYYVYNSIGEKFEIARIDRQGVNNPPRWIEVQNGDPTTTRHSYENYIKASKGNLYKKEGDYSKFSVPRYPNLYDYYKSNRLISEVQGVITHELQNKLSIINGHLGPVKECNIIIIILKSASPDFFYALNNIWDGANKNDIVVMISVDASKNIEWANILCLAESDIFRVTLRDDIMALKTLDMEKILSEIEKDVKQYYQRKSMKKFEYLKSSIEPTFGQILFILILNSVICIGFTIFFYKDSSFD